MNNLSSETVRERNLVMKSGVCKVDADLAIHLQRINEAGFVTITSCSGTQADHPGRGDSNAFGYIAFIDEDNKPAYQTIVSGAAKEAGLTFEEDDIFFCKGVSVRFPETLDGLRSSELTQTANTITNTIIGDWKDKEQNFFMDTWLPKRDFIREELVKAHGEQNFSDDEINRRWAKFTENLINFSKEVGF